MPRLSLYLPVCLLGFPILIVLILAASQTGVQSAIQPVEYVAPAAAPEEPQPAPRTMEQLAREDPLAFLENCTRRYHQEVRTYTATLEKQEFVGGSLQPKELIQVKFREQPYSVFLLWLEGARKAERALYVEGEHNGKLLARPCGVLARSLVGDVVERDVDGPEAQQSGRSTLNKFGLLKSTERALGAWKTAREAGILHVEYLGVRPVKELNDRPCYELHARYDQPIGDGVRDVVLFLDRETWLQLGSVSRGEEGKLIGSYFYRDLKLNPDFKKEEFERSALTP